MSLTDGGTKVETDTTRNMGEFDAAWDDDDTPEAPATDPAEIEAAGTPEETAPGGATNDAAPASPAEPQAITRDDGATWSEKSQRWHKDGKIVAGEPPASVAKPESPKVEQAPQAPTPPVTPPAPAAEAPTPTPVEPFVVRANGKRVDIPGLHAVAPEHRDAIRGLIVDGLNHRQNFPRMQAEWKQKLAQAEALVEAKSGKYNNAAVVLHEAIYGNRKANTPPTLLTALLRELPAEVHDRVAAAWAREAGYVERDVSHVMRAADLTIPKPVEAPPQDEAALERSVRGEFAGALDELFDGTPNITQFVTEKDREEIAAAFQHNIEAFIVGQNDRGEKGYFVDMEKLKKAFARDIGLYQRAHQAKLDAARDAEQVRKAAAFNAATNTPPKPPVSTRPKPALAAAPIGTAKTPDQLFNEAWNSGDDDD